jgi:hypothetical protein
VPGFEPANVRIAAFSQGGRTCAEWALPEFMGQYALWPGLSNISAHIEPLARCYPAQLILSLIKGFPCPSASPASADVGRNQPERCAVLMTGAHAQKAATPAPPWPRPPIPSTLICSELLDPAGGQSG